LSDVDPDTQLVGYIRAHLLLTVAISMRRGGEDAVASVLHTDCTSHQRCFIGPHDDAIRLCLPLRPAAIPGRRPASPGSFLSRRRSFPIPPAAASVLCGVLLDPIHRAVICHCLCARARRPVSPQ